MAWNDRYVEGDTPWDAGAPSPLVLRLADELLSPAAAVVIPGCGRGWEVQALAARGFDATGLDLAPEALRQAAARVGPAPRVRWRQADLLTLPDDLIGRFDAVVEHTCFCALEPALLEGYVRAARALLRPGGRLFGAFLRFEGAARPGRDGPPFGTSPAALRALFEPHFVVERLAEAPELFTQAGVPQLEVVLRRA